jgi:hypothetical protein
MPKAKRIDKPAPYRVTPLGVHEAAAIECEKDAADDLLEAHKALTHGGHRNAAADDAEARPSPRKRARR